MTLFESLKAGYLLWKFQRLGTALSLEMAQPIDGISCRGRIRIGGQNRKFRGRNLLEALRAAATDAYRGCPNHRMEPLGGNTPGPGLNPAMCRECGECGAIYVPWDEGGKG